MIHLVFPALFLNRQRIQLFLVSYRQLGVKTPYLRYSGDFLARSVFRRILRGAELQLHCLVFMLFPKSTNDGSLALNSWTAKTAMGCYVELSIAPPIFSRNCSQIFERVPRPPLAARLRCLRRLHMLLLLKACPMAFCLPFSHCCHSEMGDRCR